MITKDTIVSVVLPVYRNDNYLAESIRSILCQTLWDLDLILLCDDPSEKTRAIITEFQQSDTRIQVICQERIGLVSCLNRGISLAKGKYIARMDADDISCPDRLEKQVAFMEAHPNCALVATQVELIDESGKLTGYWKADLETDTSEKIRKRLPFENCIAHPTVLFRNTIADHYLYDPVQKNTEDYDIWLRLASDNLVLCKIPEKLVRLRIHPTSITSSSRKAAQGSDVIRCKVRYLAAQLRKGKISFFNLKVLFYLIVNCLSWPLNNILLNNRFCMK